MQWRLFVLIPEVDVFSHKDASLELVNVIRPDSFHEVVFLESLSIV